MAIAPTSVLAAASRPSRIISRFAAPAATARSLALSASATASSFNGMVTFDPRQAGSTRFSAR